MKKLSLASLIVGAIFFAACNGSSSSDTMNSDTTTNMTSSGDTSQMMPSSADTSKMAMVGDDAKDFSKEAAQGGMMEVQLGNLAMKNGGTQAVKDFGKMMVDDHTKINDQMKDLASKKNVDLPATVSDDQQKDIDKLSKKTGKEFDKDYVSMMVKDHKDDIDAFKKAQDKISDNDYKTFISNALPTLQKHLDAIEAIHKKM
jgi:putative membrane protein